MPDRRHAAGVALIVLGMALAVLSRGPLKNLWADYQDSPAWVYLMNGLPFLVAACGAWWAAYRLLRSTRH